MNLLKVFSIIFLILLLSSGMVYCADKETNQQMGKPPVMGNYSSTTSGAYDPMERYQYALFDYSDAGPAQPGVCLSREVLRSVMNEWGANGWEFPNAIIVNDHGQYGEQCYRLKTPGSEFLIGRRRLTVQRGRNTDTPKKK
ncbi:MAG: hypothetical protein WA666_07560 [Nitrospirota bacterium]